MRRHHGLFGVGFQLRELSQESHVDSFLLALIGNGLNARGDNLVSNENVRIGVDEALSEVVQNLALILETFDFQSELTVLFLGNLSVVVLDLQNNLVLLPEVGGNQVVVGQLGQVNLVDLSRVFIENHLEDLEVESGWLLVLGYSADVGEIVLDFDDRTSDGRVDFDLVFVQVDPAGSSDSSLKEK